MTQEFLGGRVVLHAGNCLDVLAQLPANSIDAVCADPPYHLTSIVKRFGEEGSAPAKGNPVYARSSAGFMGKKWDGGDVAFRKETWAAVYRVLKPGGYLLSFSGTRTYHRMAAAIEDAGFEIRDMINWVYGSGFPKSLDISKAIDRAAGAERKVVSTEKVRDIRNGNGRGLGDGIHAANRDGPVYMERGITVPMTEGAQRWEGWGTALKPAQEPICIARKPIEGTNADNVLKWGTGGLNIDGCRVGDEERFNPSASPNEIYGQFAGSERSGRAALGRWPANLIHDGSDEVLAAFPTTGDSHPPDNEGSVRKNHIYGVDVAPREFHPGFADIGSAARFFYTAKADAEDRLGSKHPTVKPLDLMQYLVRLVTPPGGLVLDPFAGTGTTGEAAWREGMRAVLIEAEPEYQSDIARRMELAEHPSKRAAVARSKNKLQGAEGTPLFEI